MPMFKQKMKEFVRKILVFIKRKPDIFALLIFVIAFIWYSFHLTDVSNTTAYVNKSWMGLTEFVTMLGSILSLVCFINAFPARKKTNVFMLVLMYALNIIVIFCNVVYSWRIDCALNGCEWMGEKATFTLDKILQKAPYVLDVVSMLTVHDIILGLGILATITLPLYKPLIKRIKTSVDVEDNGELENIELSE